MIQKGKNLFGSTVQNFLTYCSFSSLHSYSTFCCFFCLIYSVVRSPGSPHSFIVIFISFMACSESNEQPSKLLRIVNFGSVTQLKKLIISLSQLHTSTSLCSCSKTKIWLKVLVIFQTHDSLSIVDLIVTELKLKLSLPKYASKDSIN